MLDELPDIVRFLTDAVSEKLGRPAHCRKVKNQDEWYVYDPVFSFIQHGMKKGGTGYRGGYKYEKSNQTLWFILVYSPILASLFKRNLVFSTLLEVLEKTADCRNRHFMLWSSKLAFQQNLKKEILSIASHDFQEVLKELKDFDDDIGFVDDLFPVVPNTGKGGGKASSAGNTFYLKLSDECRLSHSIDDVKRLIALTWPLFLCLYPVKPIEKRSAALARKLRSAKIPRTCEFSSIKFESDLQIGHLCRGEIQGAHIKPHATGGSDLPVNGMWLCEYHHRMTEGKLAGSRIDGGLNVRYVGK